MTGLSSRDVKAIQLEAGDNHELHAQLEAAMLLLLAHNFEVTRIRKPYRPRVWLTEELRQHIVRDYRKGEKVKVILGRYGISTSVYYRAITESNAPARKRQAIS